MNQSTSINLLFICSRNQLRSPTAEKLFRNYSGLNTRSAGTSPNAKRTVSSNDIRWADIIFVMETKHKNRLIAKFTRLIQYSIIHNLEIPDQFKFMDPVLADELKRSVEPLIQKR
jgi:predicted protein tyrosine phosphatase